MHVADVMTREVVTVSPDTSLKDVASALVSHRISGLPVVDESGEVLGVVSEADILATESGPPPPPSRLSRLLRPRSDGVRRDARTAREAMSRPAETIEPERELAEAASAMIERGVNRLPVVDTEGHLVGIVTRADIVRAFIRSDEEIAREIELDILLRMLWIDPERVDVTVRDGQVTLTGIVESRADAELLEAFVSRLSGVVGLQSRLRWNLNDPKLAQSDPWIPRVPRTH